MWYTAACLEFKATAAPLISEPTRHAKMACHQFTFKLSRDEAAAQAPEVKLYEYQTAK